LSFNRFPVRKQWLYPIPGVHGNARKKDTYDGKPYEHHNLSIGLPVFVVAHHERGACFDEISMFFSWEQP
jgi:hypothetical protein